MPELENADILTYKVENPEGQTNGYQKPDKRFTGTYSGKYGTLAEHYYQGEGRDFIFLRSDNFTSRLNRGGKGTQI